MKLLALKLNLKKSQNKFNLIGYKTSRARDKARTTETNQLAGDSSPHPPFFCRKETGDAHSSSLFLCNAGPEPPAQTELGSDLNFGGLARDAHRSELASLGSFPIFLQSCNVRLTWRVVSMGVGVGVGGRTVVPQRWVPFAAVSGGERQGGSELRVRVGRWAQSPSPGNEPTTYCGEARGL